MTENEQYIFDLFRIDIMSGFDSLEDIIDGAVETVEEEGWSNEISRDWIEKMLTAEYQKNVSASQTWQHPTHPERLHQVFDSLCKNNKIVALHNAGYTDSDALYDIQEVWEDLEDNGVNPIGYCYYHGQDLERVIEEGVLCIGFYGKKKNNDKEAIIIGHKVVEALKDAGFNIEWNNTASRRIEIIDFNWQNVFTSSEDVEEKWGYERVLQLMQ